MKTKRSRFRDHSSAAIETSRAVRPRRDVSASAGRQTINWELANWIGRAGLTQSSSDVLSDECV
jgi:hypothetical protein